MPRIGWNIFAPSLSLVLGFLRFVANLWHKKTEAPHHAATSVLQQTNPSGCNLLYCQPGTTTAKLPGIPCPLFFCLFAVYYFIGIIDIFVIIEITYCIVLVNILYCSWNNYRQKDILFYGNNCIQRNKPCNNKQH